MKFETIAWKNNKVVLIDQTKLPQKAVFVECKTVKQVWQAIKVLKVRGAPAIGAAAALGMLLGISKVRERSFSGFRKQVRKTAKYLASSRPTAVNLAWALKRMEQVADQNRAKSVSQIKDLMYEQAQKIIAEDKKSCAQMADNAQVLIRKNDRIMTYCNAGMLATAGIGTAIGVIYRANQLRKKVKVFSCETRPLLQGARLSCWELQANKVDVTVLCDNMAGYLMSQKKIDKVFVGADRIAANGDAANKIGSYSLAVLARYHKVPFYVVAPFSTFDLSLKTGKQIPIEQRHPDEVKKLWYKRPMVADKVKVYNPAFDVIPAGLITAIVTDLGLIRPPYKTNIQRVLKT